MLLGRPRLARVVVTVLSLVMGYLGLRLSRFDIAVADTIVDPSSDAFKHEVQYENAFGADPIVVLVTGDVRSIFGGHGLQQLIRVEANMPNADNSRRGVQSLSGPTSIATVSATEAEGALLARVQQAERAAQAKALAEARAAGKSDADANAAANSAATADNPAWVSAIFLDSNGKPKARFYSLVPDASDIVISGRLNYATGESAINTITNSIRSDLASNPIPGATAIVTGVPVLEAAVGHALVALLAIYRHRRMALFAWFPTLLVAGWSTVVLFALRIPLTPMTAVLGALVVAFGTEFAILWLERYRDAVSGGEAAGAEAAEMATRAAGPGIIVSGCALTLGFLALTVGGRPGARSLGFDLPMVRDFGLVAAMDMVLALVAALVVLPAAVVRLGLPLPASARAAVGARG